MRLTDRCIEIMKLLRVARWLTTSQVKRRFWPHATEDAARKRLRILTGGKYLYKLQEHQMQEALFTLGPEGKRELERRRVDRISLERKPPKQREHFLAVNDIRIAAELTGSLSFFFGYWELPALNLQHAVIPDAVMALGDRCFAVEFDRGKETAKYFVKTKMSSYHQGLSGFSIKSLLIFTDRKARLLSLAEKIADSNLVLFATMEQVRKEGLLAPIFYQYPEEYGVRII